jgi:hypothetical protein
MRRIRKHIVRPARREGARAKGICGTDFADIYFTISQYSNLHRTFIGGGTCKWSHGPTIYATPNVKAKFVGGIVSPCK